MKKEILCVITSFILSIVISFFLKGVFTIPKLSEIIVTLIIFLMLFLILTFILRLTIFRSVSKSTMTTIKEGIPKVNNNVNTPKESEELLSENNKVEKKEFINKENDLLNKDKLTEKKDKEDSLEDKSKQNNLPKKQNHLNYFEVPSKTSDDSETNSKQIIKKEEQLVKENINEPAIIKNQDQTYKDIQNIKENLDENKPKIEETTSDKENSNILKNKEIENSKKEESFIKLSKFKQVNEEDKE